VRNECIDQLLTLDQRHLQRVLVEDIDFYNHSRPHQGLNQNIPQAPPHSGSDGPIGRRDPNGEAVRSEEDLDREHSETAGLRRR
jgi:hypothetical protein